MCELGYGMESSGRQISTLSTSLPHIDAKSTDTETLDITPRVHSLHSESGRRRWAVFEEMEKESVESAKQGCNGERLPR